MLALFLLLGILGMVLNANAIIVVPTICIKICFIVAGVCFAFPLVDRMASRRASKEALKRFR